MCSFNKPSDIAQQHTRILVGVLQRSTSVVLPDWWRSTMGERSN
jgi:hypothetical protein